MYRTVSETFITDIFSYLLRSQLGRRQAKQAMHIHILLGSHKMVERITMLLRLVSSYAVLCGHAVACELVELPTVF